jgi:hypothetical protein
VAADKVPAAMVDKDGLQPVTGFGQWRRQLPPHSNVLQAVVTGFGPLLLLVPNLSSAMEKGKRSP